VIYTAKSARFIMGGSYLELRMDNGVRLEGAGADQRMLSFDHYQVSIPLSDGKWSKRKSGDHVTMMTMTELWEQMQSAKPAAATAELSRRILLPSTVLILFFFALPLSITQKRSGKAGSLISGIALLVMIYNAQLLLHRQVSQGAFPGWTMWAAQIAMLMLAMFLWRRAEADRMPRLFAVAGEWIYYMHQWIMHRLAHRWSQQREH
jgi:lipopolysaccharide export LptBFGC system permease protein LptF